VSRRIATVGVYGFTADTFMGALREARVGVLLDVRRRRGVRGAQYAWANARRLQDALSAAGIEYRHLSELAMPDELRKLQHRYDERAGVGQRSRVELAPEVRDRYRAEVLDRVDLEAIAASLPPRTLAALMCVEGDPAACHRSLIAERWAGDVLHLRP
jgi:uncharacterized protein (DUF488 family)